jgi:signal transduction histidine kinase
MTVSGLAASKVLTLLACFLGGLGLGLYRATLIRRHLNSELEASRARLEQVEREMTAQVLQLERNNREMQELSRIASHDLQEPLRKVQAFGDRLRARCESSLDAEGRDYLARMLASVTQKQELLDDLLELYRVTSQGQPFVPTPLNRPAREALAQVESLLRETAGHVELRDLPTVEADPRQMRLLLRHLLDNALKFHRPGRPPRVTVHGEPGPEGAEQECRILVQDDGIGFDEKYLDKVFLPFQRLHARGTYPGTGMGLAICQKIVLRHGGTITARSVPEHGTTFLISLPLRQGGGPERKPA